MPLFNLFLLMCSNPIQSLSCAYVSQVFMYWNRITWPMQDESAIENLSCCSMFSWIRSTNSFQKNNKVDNLHSDWVTLLLRDNFDDTLPLQVTHSSERIIQLLNNSQLRRDIFLTLGESLLILAFHHQWEVFSADALLKLARDIFFPCAFGLFSRV